MTKADKRFAFKVILISVIALLVMHFVTVAANPDVEKWTTHAVAPGDTLWSIAKEYNPEYTGDIRHITYQIKKANGMDDSAIMAGDVLEVPVME